MKGNSSNKYLRQSTPTVPRIGSPRRSVCPAAGIGCCSSVVKGRGRGSRSSSSEGTNTESRKYSSDPKRRTEISVTFDPKLPAQKRSSLPLTTTVTAWASVVGGKSSVTRSQQSAGADNIGVLT
eukprot:scaffold36869_cov160-Amphora_coffeaeformis.AAC.2